MLQKYAMRDCAPRALQVVARTFLGGEYLYSRCEESLKMFDLNESLLMSEIFFLHFLEAHGARSGPHRSEKRKAAEQTERGIPLSPQACTAAMY